MSIQRKTDKYRLIEKRGEGIGENYKPWLKVHEFGTRSRSHRMIGWKHKRIFQLMSDLELYFFLLLQWNENILEIREQYPLLPLEQTLLISEEIQVVHPPKTQRIKTVMTTDFLVAERKNNEICKLAIAIKTDSELSNLRTVDKLRIEKEYWDIKGIPWAIVTDKNIDKVKAINIYSIYNDYFWGEESGYTENEIKRFIFSYKTLLVKNEYDFLRASKKFEDINGWINGEGIRFFKYLLAIKEIKTNMNVKFDFRNMKVWI
ncbi:MAG: TnsA endonuclease N-terminal domain-containing protein [Clostridium sp.]|uniref:TnsA endonuclease N-terminal domain-containing protein n=1 Tax=Clostridium sp. TaxID=1506 RepID=UPI002FCBE431